MAKVETLQELFVHEIRDLYDAERQLVRALPKVAQACQSKELKTTVENHLEETRRHVERLEHVFQALNVDPKGNGCEAMQGLIEEGEELIKNTDASPTRDAGLIGAAQRIEHYEMAGYGTARAFAEALGHREAVSRLQETLDEEGEANKKLNALALEKINMQAVEQSEAKSSARR